jgi:transposase
MPGQRIDSYKRGQIVALHRFAHWSQHQIADTLQISRTTVRRIVHQSEHGEPRTPPRPKGRPPVCTTRKRSRLVDRLRLSTENRRLPLDQLARLEHLHYDIRTLRKALEKEGYSRRIARSKPLLTEKQKERRLQWARDHLNWSDRQWGRVIWTDEASIRCGHFGQVYVTRAIGEEFEPDCLVARFRKYSACMIWGAIASDGPKDIFIFEKGRIDGAKYRDKILPRLSQISRDHENRSLFNQEPIIMQDNAPIHKAFETMALLMRSGLQVMEWPANSPDLNPIKNIWAILKFRIARHFPTTREAIIQAIRLEWANLAVADCAKACQSMRQRCQAVIDANGGHTRW